MARREAARRRREIYRQAKQALRRRSGQFDLFLSDIATDVGCSPRQLQRVLREQAGQSFRELLLRIRMERARVFLTRATRPLSTQAVAERVGYRNASGLRQAFLRYWGVNPSAVRPETPDELYAEVFPDIDFGDQAPKKE